MIIVVPSIVKNYRKFLSYALLAITCVMCSTSACTFIIKMVFNIMIIFYHKSNYVQNVSCKFSRFLSFHAILSVPLLIVSFSSFQSQWSSFHALSRICKFFFMQSLPLCISCLFSIVSSVHIVDIEYQHQICPSNFTLDDFLWFKFCFEI